MQIVVLYFPYEINLRAFLSEEKLTVKPATGSLVLGVALEEKQVEKACRVYGAVPYE